MGDSTHLNGSGMKLSELGTRTLGFLSWLRWQRGSCGSHRSGSSKQWALRSENLGEATYDLLQMEEGLCDRHEEQ